MSMYELFFVCFLSKKLLQCLGSRAKATPFSAALQHASTKSPGDRLSGTKVPLGKGLAGPVPCVPAALRHVPAYGALPRHGTKDEGGSRSHRQVSVLELRKWWFACLFSLGCIAM